MKNLIEKIAGYKRATQTLVDKTEEFETFVKENVPFEMWGQFGLKKFGRDETHHISVENLHGVKQPIPSTTDKFRKHFYWGNDFDYGYTYCSGENLIEWCKELPALMAKAEAYLADLTKNAEQLA